MMYAGEMGDTISQARAFGWTGFEPKKIKHEMDTGPLRKI